MSTSRRDFLKTSSIVTASAAALSLGVARSAHGEGTDETIKAVLVGCGGRGRGAAGDFKSNPNTEVIACADAFENNARGAASGLGIKEEAIFWGFDGFVKAIDYAYQNGARYAILATSPGFRPIHYKYAIEKGMNVFMEKPCCVDAPGFKMLMEVNQIADEKGLKVGVGLQRHHQDGYLAGYEEIIEGGKYGDLLAARVYWNGGGVWVRPKTAEQTEMDYQMRNWYYFNWLCGDNICEQHVHNLDVGQWFLGAGKDPKGFHPVKANAMGGREVRGRDGDPKFGEIFDHHYVEFTYADGRKMYSQCRHIGGAWSNVSESVTGTKGNGGVTERNKDGKYKKGNPYQIEHTDLIAAIKENKAYNEGWYAANSCMCAVLGRMASYSGQEVSWDDAINKGEALMIYKDNDKLTMDSPAPVQPIEVDGKVTYRLAIPGQTSPFAGNNFGR